jgi:hypothetical protein
MIRYCYILKTKDGPVRRIYTGIDKVQVVTRMNNDMSACYYEWEVTKSWRLQ